jgi:hypothetical protein
MVKVTLSIEQQWQYEKLVYLGNIQIGTWNASFLASAFFWSDKYFSQWKSSLNTLLNEADTTGLITPMHGPKIANHITGWTLYRFHKEVVSRINSFSYRLHLGILM